MKTLSVIAVIENLSSRYVTYCFVSTIDVDNKTPFDVEQMIVKRVSSFLDSPAFMVPSHAKRMVSVSHCVY